MIYTVIINLINMVLPKEDYNAKKRCQYIILPVLVNGARSRNRNTKLLMNLELRYG